MGWWTIRSVESGGIDWNRQNPNRDESIGDGPADVLDDFLTRRPCDHAGMVERFQLALAEIREEYQQVWEREPSDRELDALWNFCTSSFDATEIAPKLLAWKEARGQA